MNKTAVLIPALNEERAIGRVVKEIKGLGFDVIVVDDGSRDRTSEIAKENGAFVIRYEHNRGKGASVIGGVEVILSRPYDGVIIMDADGQHNPQEIFKFLEFAEKNKSSFIIGNRMTDTASMPVIRVITNRFMSILLSMICRQRIPDTQCGYKYIKSGVLKKLKLTSLKYDIESELLIEAARCGVKIDSMPIESIYREEKSNIRPMVDTVRFIRLLINKAVKKEPC